MEEKQLWSEVAKIIRSCERRRKRTKPAAPAPSQQASEPTDTRPSDHQADTSRLPPPKTRGSQRPGGRKRSHEPQEQRFERFSQAIEEILRHDHEVNMDVTLRGDMARAFHITLAIGKHLWNLDEQVMVQRILQTGVEHIILEHNSEVALRDAQKTFRPLLDDLLGELETDEP
jgi:hypothetical protein